MQFLCGLLGLTGVIKDRNNLERPDLSGIQMRNTVNNLNYKPEFDLSDNWNKLAVQEVPS
jgi:hypothetical protein